jgi:hypothetical protein
MRLLEDNAGCEGCLSGHGLPDMAK